MAAALAVAHHRRSRAGLRRMLGETIPCSQSPGEGTEACPRPPTGLEGMEVKGLVSLPPEPGPALPGCLSFPVAAKGKPAGVVARSSFAFGPEVVSSAVQGEKGPLSPPLFYWQCLHSFKEFIYFSEDGPREQHNANQTEDVLQNT